MIPGPSESEADFRRRLEDTKQSFLALGEKTIPPAHWDFARAQLREIFDIAPEHLPAFYSNRSLMPWQGAAAWVEGGRITSIQLREALRKGTFLGLYDRSEILAHEAVHAARSAFPNDPWEEFFAYMTSEKKWRRILGPIVQRPWEVWPFFLCCIAGPFWEGAFLGAALWAALGFWRLAKKHRTLHKASQTLQPLVKHPRAVLLRLTDEEIEALARGVNVLDLQAQDMSFRWQMIRSYQK